MQPVIRSLLDTDLYKFTMWQTMLHRHPATQAEYTFVCRNEPAFPLAELLDEVNAQLDHLCRLKFTVDDLAYLGSLRFMRSTSSTSCAYSISSASSSARARSATSSRSSPAARRCT